MEIEILNKILTDGSVVGFLIVILFMIYKTGLFLSPLISNYVTQQVLNQSNIAKTLLELSELQKISNVRLEAIERQLSLIEGVG